MTKEEFRDLPVSTIYHLSIKVFISKNIDKSIKYYGSAPTMYEMAGSPETYTIMEKFDSHGERKGVRVRYEKTNSSYVFHMGDVEIAHEITPEKKDELKRFNVENIVPERFFS